MKTKGKIFYDFSAESGKPLEHSALPINPKFFIQSRLVSLDFNEDESLKIIRALNIYKAHGHDNISIRMIKICDKSLLKLLILLFQDSNKSSFQTHGKGLTNIVPVHKRMKSNYLKTTEQYFFYSSLANILRK